MRGKISLERSVLSYNSQIEGQCKTLDSVLITNIGTVKSCKVIYTEWYSLVLIILFWFVYFLSLWSEPFTSAASFENPKEVKSLQDDSLSSFSWSSHSLWKMSSVDVKLQKWSHWQGTIVVILHTKSQLKEIAVLKAFQLYTVYIPAFEPYTSKNK